jgi:hypothetical protein
VTGTRHAKFKHALLREVCERLRRDPALVANGRRYIERFMAPDPRMAEYYALWREVIELPVDTICDRLRAETPEGEALRDSCPVFTVLPQELRMRLARGVGLDEAV